MVLVALMLATASITTLARADEPSGAADGAGEAAVGGESDSEAADGSASGMGGLVPAASAAGDAEPDADAAGPEPAGAPTLASYLSSGMLRVSSDVVLVDGDDEAIEPVVGSFTVDGFTYAIVGEGQVALVAVAPRTLAGGLAGDGAGPDGGFAGEPASLALPEAVPYDGSEYSLAAIGPRALAGCEAAAVVLPASAESVDPAAFEGSSVASVEVAEGNPAYSSYDGMLFDADLTSLLLIPEGKQGAARIPSTAQEVDPSCLSHSAGVSSFSVDAGCAAFYSENGCLYDASSTLLWAPPGSEGAAMLEAGEPEGAGAAAADDGLPAASLGEASSARSAKDVTVTCATDAWVWKDKPSGASSEKSYSMAKGSSRTMDRGTCSFVELLPASSGSSTYAVAGHYQPVGDAQGTVERSAWSWYLGPSSSSSSIAVETGAAIVWADGRRQPMLVGEHYEAQPGMRIELHRGVDVKVTLLGKDGSSSTKIGEAYAVNGQAMPAVTPPERPGYRFMGYYTGANGSGTRYYDASGKSDKAMSQKTELKLFAYWVPEVRVFANGHRLEWEQRATYDGGANKVTEDKGTIESDESRTVASKQWRREDNNTLVVEELLASAPSTTERWHNFKASEPGWSIGGWMYGPLGTRPNADALEDATAGTNHLDGAWVYPIWVAGMYNISFDPTGGSGGQALSVQATFQSDMPTISSEAPARPGYAFTGWYDEQRGGAKYYTAEGKSARKWDKASDTTLYAQWAGIPIKLRWDAAGGAPSTTTIQAYAEGGKLDLPEPPTRKGYSFDGWYTAAEDGDQVTPATPLPTVDSVYFARWSPKIVTIHANGHDIAYTRAVRTDSGGIDRTALSLPGSGQALLGLGSATVKAADASDLFIDEPQGYAPLGSWHSAFRSSSSDWRIIGWATSPSGPALAHPWSSDQDGLHLYALWRDSSYSESENGMGRYQCLVDEGRANVRYRSYARSLHLDGSRHDEATGPVVEIEGASSGGKLEIPCYQAFQSATADVLQVFHDKETFAADAELRSREDLYRFEEDRDNPTGYHIVGWEVDGRLLGSQEFLVPSQRITVKARTEPNAYAVEYDGSGATSGATEPSQHIYDEASRLTVNGFAKRGHKFIGWATSPNGSKAYGNAMLVKNLTRTNGGTVRLWAVWEARTYLVSFDSQGGEGGPAEATTVVFGSAMPSLSAHIPKRSGYVLDGWYDTDLATAGVKYYNADGSSARDWDKVADATLFARWMPCDYAVSFDANGGEGGQADAVTATYGATMPAISPAGPTRAGYEFMGWYDDADHATAGAKQYYTAAGASAQVWDKPSDATLYAGWEALSYGIAYDAVGGELAADARSSYTIEDAAFDLPVPTRYGYQFDGWDVSGVAEDGSAGPVQGAGVETVTAEDGSKATRVKAGTYGDLSCTARWTLRYDLDVPVADPGSVAFEADSLTGQVRVAPGTSADGELLSYMAAPVALDELACVGLGPSGEPDASGGALELEAIFGEGSAAKVRFTATLGEGASALMAKVTASGGPSSTASLAGLPIPAAASRDAPGRIKVSYGLELDADLAIPPVRDAAPVARLAYTVSLPGWGA